MPVSTSNSSPRLVVLQFKITLNLPTPIWRRIQVPKSYSFWDLSVAIQDVMGNADSRLHFFRVRNPETFEMESIGTPKRKKSLPFCKVNGAKTCIGNYFFSFNKKAVYVYDKRQHWRYDICYEKRLLGLNEEQYPKCIDGQRANPSPQSLDIFNYVYRAEHDEDFDGEKFMKVLLSLRVEKAKLEDFDPMSVKFADPRQSLKVNVG